MRILKILAGIVLIGIAGYFAWMALMPDHQGLQQSSSPTESSMDLRTEKPSENGLYTVSFTPARGEPSTGPISVWHLKVSDNAGASVRGAKISVDGGMPAHGHGLPTSPAATGEVEPGIYAIDGIKFSMVGHWVFDVTIEAAAGVDTVRFNRVLE